LVTYAGQPPTNEQLRADVFERVGGQVHPYTYVVATAFLARQRDRVAPDHQRAERGAHLLFARAARYMLTSRQLRVASRSEERVLLGRALSAAAGDHPARQAQLKQDLFRWQKAFAHLSELGLDVAGGFDHALLQPLTPSLGEVMQAAQPAFLQAQQQARPQPTPTFETAAHAYFASAHYQPTPVIYLEGFTFLTPLQQHFIDCSLQKGANVYLIYPQRPTQADGYEVMQGTYGRFDQVQYGTVRHLALQTEEVESTSDLTRLQNQLFTDALSVEHEGDGTLNLRAYGHLHEEVNAALLLVQARLAAGIRPEHIVLVTRDPERYRAVLAEQAALLGIELSLHLPPRALLLTPTGRFILTLYGVWNRGVFHLMPEQFETVLRSGWLGTPARISARVFADVQHQVFSRCQTLPSWRDALHILGELIESGPPAPRTPVATVTRDHLTLWHGALNTIEALSTRLFSSGEQSIQAHVQHLLRELDGLPTAQTLEEERELLAQLRAALEELTTYSSLNLSGEEFGEVISGLVRQREDAPDLDETEPPAGRVPVVAPESLDGAVRPVVIYLGLDNRKVPRLQASAWPFQDPQLPAQQVKERYLFLAVVRAAAKELHLSYAMADEKDRYTPSIFFTDISRLLQRGVPSPPTHSPRVASPADQVDAAPVNRPVYTLDELFHFGLCPARYRLERLSPSAGVYGNAFQVGFLAQGHWLDGLWTSLIYERPVRSGKELTATLERARIQTEAAARQAFPGLRDVTWRGVDHQVRAELAHLAVRIGNYAGGFPISFHGGPTDPVRYTVRLNDASTREVTARFTRQVQRGTTWNLDTTEATQREWLIPGTWTNESDYREVDSLQLFATQYQAYRAWLDARKALYYNAQPGRTVPELARTQDLFQRLITSVERGHYPKAPGDHCAFCPAQRPCLPTIHQDES